MTEEESEEHECTRFGNLRVRVYSGKMSPARETEGIPWSFRVWREDTVSMGHFILAPIVDDALRFWCIDVEAECTIDKGGSRETIQKRHRFDYDCSPPNHLSFGWKRVNEEKGFVKYEPITIDISVKISIEGVNLSPKPRIFLFSASDVSCPTIAAVNEPSQQNIQLVSSVPESDGSSLLVARRQREIVARVEPAIDQKAEQPEQESVKQIEPSEAHDKISPDPEEMHKPFTGNSMGQGTLHPGMLAKHGSTTFVQPSPVPAVVASQSTAVPTPLSSMARRPTVTQRSHQMASSSSNGNQTVSFVRSSNLTKTLTKMTVDFSRVDELMGELATESDSLSDHTLPTLSSCALEKWCAKYDLDAAVVANSNIDRWQPEVAGNCSPDLTKLLLFDKRREILEAMKSSDVVVVITKTGTGKSLIGPALLAELLRADVENGKKSYSRRGLSLCPSSDHATNTVKIAEKLYMTRPRAYCEIANFVDHFAKSNVMLEYDPSNEFNYNTVFDSAKHAITTYRGGLKALEGGASFLQKALEGGASIRLRLLHIDEAHSAKAELHDLLALARLQLHSKRVEKLVLTSATIDDDEIRRLQSYFAEEKLSLGVVNLSPEIPTTNRLVMTCVGLDAERATILSKRITQDFEAGKAHKPSEHEEKKIWRFGSEENKDVPEMNRMLPWFKTAVDRAMERTTELMEWRGDNRMPSILILIPGQEHADRIRSTIENTYLDSEGGPKYPYEFFTFKDSGKPAFIIERLRSVRRQKVAGGMPMRAEAELDDSVRLVTLTEKSREEEKRINASNEDERKKKTKWQEKMNELRDPRGPGFEKGKIILATPTMAEGLTLEDVAIVVDAGVSRISGPYLRSGLRQLILTWIDKKLLYQRAGRCGRTCDGEYFVCVSAKKVHSILNSDNKQKLFVAHFDELSWMRAVQLGVIDELIWTPPPKLTDEFKKSFMIRGLWKEDKFTKEADELYTYFPFLTPDIARFVVMGVRLGLAAHTICYVAEHMSSHKLCGRPTKIRENYEAISDSQAYDTYVNVPALSTWRDEEIRPYCMGDSVCKADMIVTWLRHTFPPIVKPSSTEPESPAQRAQSKSDEASKESEPLPDLNIELELDFDIYDTYDDKKWKQLEQLAEEAPDGFYWTGNWCPGKGDKRDEMLGMKRLQQVFIRSEGRESLCMNVSMLTKACQRLRIISPLDHMDPKEKGSIFAPRFNRYLRALNNYNLSTDGRALFRALLTESSDKMASNYRKEWTNADGVKNYDHVFEIHATTEGGADTFEDFFPERRDWKARAIESNAAKAATAKAKPKAVKGKDGRRGPDKSVETKETAQFVRYWNAFKATHSYTFTGCADPISVKQAAFFLNTFGVWKLEGDSISILLNASPAGIRNGITIGMLDEEVKRRVSTARSSLLRVSSRIVADIEPLSDGRKFDKIAEAIINLWKALDDGTEATIQIPEEWQEKAKTLALYVQQLRPDRRMNDEMVMQQE